jgi:hypothetical protein
MRTIFAALVSIALSASAGAQTIGLPLPEIGLPLPPTGLPPLHQNSTIETHPAPRLNPRTTARGRVDHGPRTFVYFVPAYGWDPFGEPLEPAAERVPDVRPSIAHLDLELQPGVDAQVFVDNFYVAMLSDLGSTVSLAPGAHRLDLHADGFEPLTFNVQAVANASQRYRGAFTPSDTSPAPAVRETPPPASSPIYMIPGCYIGNLPPRQIKLPAGCDAAQATLVP